MKKHARRWSIHDGRGIGSFFPNAERLSWRSIATVLACVFVGSLLLSLPQLLGAFSGGEGAGEGQGEAADGSSSSSSTDFLNGPVADESSVASSAAAAASADAAGQQAMPAPKGPQSRKPQSTTLAAAAKVAIVMAARGGFPRETVRRLCSITSAELAASIVPVQVVVVMFTARHGDSDLTELRALLEPSCLRGVEAGATGGAAGGAPPKAPGGFLLLFVDDRSASSSLADMYNAGVAAARKDVTHFVFLDGAASPREGAARFIGDLIAPMLTGRVTAATFTNGGSGGGGGGGSGGANANVLFPQVAGCCIVDPLRDLTISKGYEVSFRVGDTEQLGVRKRMALLTRRYNGFTMYDDRNFLVDGAAGLVGPHCLAVTRGAMRRLKGFRSKFPTREDHLRSGGTSVELFMRQLVELHAMQDLTSDMIRAVSVKEIQMASAPDRGLIRRLSLASQRLQRLFNTEFNALNATAWFSLAKTHFEALKQKRDAFSTDKMERIQFAIDQVERAESAVMVVLNDLASEEELGVDLSLSINKIAAGDLVGVEPATGRVLSPLLQGLVLSTNATVSFAAGDRQDERPAAAPTGRGGAETLAPETERLRTLTKELLSTVMRMRSSFVMSPVLLRYHEPMIDAIYSLQGAMVFAPPAPPAAMSRSLLVGALKAGGGGGGGGGDGAAGAAAAAALPVSRLRVYWEMWCCNCCGFTTELTSYLVGIRRSLLVEASIPPSCYCENNVPYVADQLFLAHNGNLMPLQDTDVLVHVHHGAPNRIGGLSIDVHEVNNFQPDFVIVRTMYEFSRIPADWVDVCNNDTRVSELWVPGQTVRQAFVDSGVRPEKLSILPEAVDVHFFDPAVHRPFRMQELPALFPDGLHCNAAGTALLVGGTRGAPQPYVFFSQYKWEPRKGWDVLLQGWADAFPGPARGVSEDANASATPPPPLPPRTDVLLLMLVNLYLVEGVNASSRFNMTYMQLAANAMLGETMGLGLDDLAPLCFLAEEITDEQLARLFRSADAFVLPTRGEGWCLPAMQAMSMALPAIVTGYGGQLEFMTNNDNSFHIAYKLVQTPKSAYYQFAVGMEWAEPSVADLTRLMQYVVAHPRAGATIGRRARDHICQHFSEEAVKTILERKLLEVQRRIGPRRLEWQQRKRPKKK